MNNILSKELAKKQLTWKSQTYTNVGAGSTGNQSSGDFTLKTSQPIYVKDIQVSYSAFIIDAVKPLGIVNNIALYNPSGLYLTSPATFCLHSSNPVPKPNDIQIIAGCIEFNATANESKQCITPGPPTDVERIIIGNFGVSYVIKISDTLGTSGTDFSTFVRVTINYAIIHQEN